MQIQPRGLLVALDVAARQVPIEHRLPARALRPVGWIAVPEAAERHAGATHRALLPFDRAGMPSHEAAFDRIQSEPNRTKPPADLT
jgi:hypothetical protein